MLVQPDTSSPNPPQPERQGPPTLNARDLHKFYRRDRQRITAVGGVSLAISPGEVLAFLGPNGAGKTTTIKMIAGLVRPDAGEVSISGRNPHADPLALQGVGAVLEGNRNLYWRLTALENLEYFGVLRGMDRRTARRRGLLLLEQFSLADKKDTPVRTFSRGMQQKLAIAVALVHNPQLLLLDEPTLGLDVEAGEHVKGLVRAIAAQGCAVLLTTHQLDVAEELSDRVAIIRQGQIVAQSTTADLIRQFSDAAYRVEVDGEISAAQRQAIAALEASVWDNVVHYLGDAPGLYQLFDILRPLPILQVAPDRPDLTDVFLKVVRDETVLGGAISSRAEAELD
ncbi:MAG: ABC transporter ATP-binding protein [Elainellaceae cyanobacterium]